MRTHFLTLLSLCLLAAESAQADIGEVQFHQKISDTEGGFAGTLTNNNQFGSSVASLGDVDGDGIAELVVGSRMDHGGGIGRGAVWILFLNPDGTVRTHQKISDNSGGFTGTLDDFDIFGCSTAAIGDLDGDGITELAVGARLDDDGGDDQGAVWILFLDDDGTVKSHQKISETDGGFTGNLSSDDTFGRSVAALGDVDGDSLTDLAVGAYLDDDGGGGPFADRGAVWILFLNADGTVKSHQKISAQQGNFMGTLDEGDLFGVSVGGLGDVDGDGVEDMAVGARPDDDGGTDRGAVWILFLNSDGTVKSHQKVSSTQGGFSGVLDDGDMFGTSLSMLGDLNGDSITDLAVGAINDDDGGTPPAADRGAVWVLFLAGNGTVKSHQKISDTQGNFTGTLDDLDSFGRSVASVPDLNGDGADDLAVGAHQDDDGGVSHGAVWMLFIDGPIPSAVERPPPQRLILEQNYPNPFHPTTRIRFTLDHGADVVVAVYNVSGAPVTTLVRARLGPGTHTTEWNGRDRDGRLVPNGVYLYRLIAGGLTATRKAVLLR